MRPQQAKASFFGLEHGYYKVSGLQEFAAGLYPLERMLLDLRHAPTADIDSLIALPWAGFMVDEAGCVSPDRPWMGSPRS